MQTKLTINKHNENIYKTKKQLNNNNNNYIGPAYPRIKSLK